MPKAVDLQDFNLQNLRQTTPEASTWLGLGSVVAPEVRAQSHQQQTPGDTLHRVDEHPPLPLLSFPPEPEGLAQAQTRFDEQRVRRLPRMQTAGNTLRRVEHSSPPLLPEPRRPEQTQPTFGQQVRRLPREMLEDLIVYRYGMPPRQEQASGLPPRVPSPSVDAEVALPVVPPRKSFKRVGPFQTPSKETATQSRRDRVTYLRRQRSGSVSGSQASVGAMGSSQATRALPPELCLQITNPINDRRDNFAAQPRLRNGNHMANLPAVESGLARFRREVPGTFLDLGPSPAAEAAPVPLPADRVSPFQPGHDQRNAAGMMSGVSVGHAAESHKHEIQLQQAYYQGCLNGTASGILIRYAAEQQRALAVQRALAQRAPQIENRWNDAALARQQQRAHAVSLDNDGSSRQSFADSVSDSQYERSDASSGGESHQVVPELP